MPTGRAFGDPDLTPDNFSSFSKQEIAADAAAKGIEQLQPIPPVRSTAPMDLSTVIGAGAADAIRSSGKITFHAVGDTGGIHSPQFQFAVADAMGADVSNSDAAFWYHLGDVVYYFGQEQYYFEQFYDPYRDYNAPIFAIPGNHDGAVFKGESGNSLDAFVANFCTPQPTRSLDSQGAVRTTMDQPGAYFVLNAPFVKFIGLYSNTSEGGTEGVISGPKVGDAQLLFLEQQLEAAKAERADGDVRALIIATHHPPFTGSPSHVPSPTMPQQIDKACSDAGIQPGFAPFGPRAPLRAVHANRGGEADSLRRGRDGGLLQPARLEATSPAARSGQTVLRKGRRWQPSQAGSLQRQHLRFPAHDRICRLNYRRIYNGGPGLRKDRIGRQLHARPARV